MRIGIGKYLFESHCCINACGYGLGYSEQLTFLIHGQWTSGNLYSWPFTTFLRSSSYSSYWNTIT